MYRAIDKFENDIDVDYARKGGEYFCPFCHSPMIVKAGQLTARHFAHQSLANCDPWYDHRRMTPWHKEHQELFPEETREVQIKDDSYLDIYHVADVFIKRENDSNIIIEFQQSPISYDEFRIRTDFYKNNKMNIVDGEPISNIVIWVFNYTEKEIFISDIFYNKYIACCTWPGKDRVRFLDHYTGDNFVYIIFQATKCEYDIETREYEGEEYEKYVPKLELNKPITYIHVFEEEDNYRTFDGIRIPCEEFVRYVTNAPTTYQKAYAHYKTYINKDDGYIWI